jgi:hypothetical protein
MSESDWTQLGALRTDWSPFDVLRHLEKILLVPVGDAKAIAAHQSFTPDVCHNCMTRLKTKSITECKRCGALNYNF